jgi:hypothetical protein
MYKRLEDDYQAYETSEVKNAASILTAMKTLYKAPRHTQYKTLKNRYSRRLKHSIKSKQTRKLKKMTTIKKLANIMENETIGKIQHVTRSGRGATRIKF